MGYWDHVAHCSSVPLVRKDKSQKVRGVGGLYGINRSAISRDKRVTVFEMHRVAVKVLIQ